MPKLRLTYADAAEVARIVTAFRQPARTAPGLLSYVHVALYGPTLVFLMSDRYVAVRAAAPVVIEGDLSYTFEGGVCIEPGALAKLLAVTVAQSRNETDSIDLEFIPETHTLRRAEKDTETEIFLPKADDFYPRKMLERMFIPPMGGELPDQVVIPTSRLRTVAAMLPPGGVPMTPQNTRSVSWWWRSPCGTTTSHLIVSTSPTGAFHV